MVTITLPRALDAYVDGKSTVVISEPVATAGDALAALGRRSAAALDRIMDERGQIRPHVNVFVGDQNIRVLDGLETPTADGSTILILAAVSGG